MTIFSIGDLKKGLTGSPYKLHYRKSAGPFIGPKGGKWADAKHTVPWHEGGGTGAHAEVSRDDAVRAIVGGIRQNARAGWLRNADRTYKDEIAEAIDSDPKLHNAALNVLHQQHQVFTGKKIPFAEFLDTPITVYRAGKTPASEAFSSFSFDKREAAKFSEEYGVPVETHTVKPRDTYGMINEMAEGEVLVPLKTADSDKYQQGEAVEDKNGRKWTVTKRAGRQVYLTRADKPGSKPMKMHEQRLSALLGNLKKSALLVKSGPPPGYQPVPKSKHGGYRKRTRAGWDYWYPEGKTPKRMPPKERIDPKPSFETIPPERAEQYRKALRRMWKEYREVMSSWNPERRWEEGWGDEKAAAEEKAAHRRYLDFRTRLHDVQGGIIDMMYRVGGKGSPRLSAFKEHAPPRMQQALWDLQHATEEIVPATTDYATKERRGKFERNEKNVKNRLARGQRMFRNALNELEVVLNERTDTKFATSEQFEQDGFRFELTEDSRDLREEKAFHGFVSRLSRVREKLKRRGIEKAVNGLVIRMADSSERHGCFAGGEYNPSKDRLTLYSISFGIGDSTKDAREDMRTEYGTLVHELGHRVFYKFLPQRAQEQWTKTYEEMRQPLTQEHIDSYIRDWTKAREQAKAARLGQTPYSFMTKMGYAEREADAPHPDPHKQFLHDKLPYAFWEKSDAEISAHFEQFLSRAAGGASWQSDAGTAIMKEQLTTYGAVNADEAWAEAFRLYVDHGPGALGPQWRRHFEDAMAAGDIPLRKSAITIAERKLLKGDTPPPGYQPVPNSKRGGFRKRKGRGWLYWYPSKPAPKKPAPKPTFPWGESKWTEDQFAAGAFDKNPAHWDWHRAVANRAPIGGVKGGVDFSSQHPVKMGGKTNALYQVVSPPSEDGWVRLRDVSSGAEREVAEDRVFPVHHVGARRRPAPPASRGPSSPRAPLTGAGEPPGDWDPTQPRPPGAVSGTPSEGAQRIPVFLDSKARKGSALHKMENGFFVRHTRVQTDIDEGGVKHRTEVERNEVDNATKTKLIAEFRGMIENVAKDVKKKFRLKTYATGKRDETLEDLRMAGMEGFLVAIERYPGGGPFSGYAKSYAEGYARVQGGRMASSLVTLPKRVQRLIPKYLAARAEAAEALGVDDPAPSQVLLFWDLRKRDLHNLGKDDPQRNEPLPLRNYKLAKKERSTSDEGKRSTSTKAKGVIEHAGKAEWADRIHNFLTGEQGAKDSGFFDDDRSVFPGVHIGAGLTESEKVEIRASVKKAMEGLDEHEITLATGRQKSRYKADTATMIMRSLGLTNDSTSKKEIAADMTIEKMTSKGWKPLGHRQKETLVNEFLKRGYARLRERMSEGDSKGQTLVARAEAAVVPIKRVARGLTWNRRVQAHARTVSTTKVQEWRAKERGRLRRRKQRLLDKAAGMPHGPDREHTSDLADGIDGSLRHITRMSNRQVKLTIAQQELTSRPMSPEMRRLMTRTVGVETSTPGMQYGRSVVTMTDPVTGQQRKVRVRTVRDLHPERRPGGGMSKSEKPDTELTAGLVWDMMHRPRLTRLLMDKDSVPSTERFVVETLAGLH